MKKKLMKNSFQHGHESYQPTQHEGLLSKLYSFRLLPSVPLAVLLGLVTALTGLTSCAASISAQNHQDTDKTVTILGPLAAEDISKFEASLRPFEEANNIDVVYQSADNFNSLLRMRIASFYKPDLAILPQPGLIADLAEDGHLVPLTDVVDIHALRGAYSDTWLDLGEVESVPYGLWTRIAVKSLVWFHPPAFEAKGYDTPKTWEALKALSDRIVADGGTPWCIGLESGAASGWPGTDWVEDILLRTAGPETYSQWIKHETPFNSPAVLAAFNEFATFLRTPDYVKGGVEGAIATNYGESSTGLFSNPPDCYMHRQGNFITSFFPENQIPRVDYDVFLLPPIDPRFGTPLLISGEAIVMFNYTPESKALIEYLLTPTPHEIWAGLGGFISPQKDIAPEAYPDLVTQNIAQILADAEVIRFDGSDLMPGYVGSEVFWDGIMTLAEGESAEAVAQTIDNSWP